MKPSLNIATFIETFLLSPLCRFSKTEPWDLTNNASNCIRELMQLLPNDEFNIYDEIAVHNSATIETGAILKGPMIIGARCLIAAGAYIRGGNWLEADCIIGPSVELKSSFIFSGTKIAHFNFVGDSIIGRDNNFEAGSIIANYRNERDNKDILVNYSNQLVNIGVQKFGALVGDYCRVGANAVIAPGSLLSRRTIIGRLELLDHEKLNQPINSQT